jgi:hypothetical protein
MTGLGPSPWRLCGRYSDFFFAFSALFAVNHPIPNLFFGCGFAALGLNRYGHRQPRSLTFLRASAYE